MSQRPQSIPMHLNFQPTRAFGGQPVNVPWDGRPHNQHPGSTSAPPAQASNAQAHFHQQMGCHLNTTALYQYPQVAAVRSPEHQRNGIPIVHYHRVSPNNRALFYPPRSGESNGMSIPQNLSTGNHRSEDRRPLVPASSYAAQPSNQHMPVWHVAAPPSTTDTAVYGRERNWQGATLPQSPPIQQEPSTPPGVVPLTELTVSPMHREPALGMEDPDGIGQCPIPGCRTKHGSRKQEFERHIREHLPQSCYCPLDGCGWRGHRNYLLQDHWEKKHKPMVYPGGEFLIYEPRGLVKQLIRREIDINQAKREANWLIQGRAIQLNKQDVWVV